MSVFKDERIWRWLTNVWTFIFLIFAVFEFFFDKFEFLVPPFSVIYIGILGLYVSTKEFDRWYDSHTSRHPGEIFVGLWTAVIVLLFAFSIAYDGSRRVSPETVAVYIMVLSVFALTQKSKKYYERKKKMRKAPWIARLPSSEK